MDWAWEEAKEDRIARRQRDCTQVLNLENGQMKMIHLGHFDMNNKRREGGVGNCSRLHFPWIIRTYRWYIVDTYYEPSKWPNSPWLYSSPVRAPGRYLGGHHFELILGLRFLRCFTHPMLEKFTSFSLYIPLTLGNNSYESDNIWMIKLTHDGCFWQEVLLVFLAGTGLEWKRRPAL